MKPLRILLVTTLAFAGAGLTVLPASAANVEITPSAGSVTASTSDDNVAANVVDNNYSTRWSGDGGSDPDDSVPADVLNLTNWKITLPIGSEGSPTEIKQPALDSYSIDPYFTVAGDAVQFRAPVNGVTTSGSSYPRSELREMTNNGSSNASWSSTSGTHTLVVRESFDHLPADKPHLVGAQIHDSEDDVTVFRLEGSSLYITNGDTTHHKLVTSSYSLGTVFEAKFVVNGGKVKAYYNGVLQTTISKSFSGAYFKAGAYTQANCTNSSPCSASNYGQTTIHSVTVTHS